MFIPHTFKNQWNGLLGDFWYKQARKEVERLYNERDNMIIEEDGAVRWISSGNYLPDDCMEKLEYAPYDLRSKISREATKIKKDVPRFLAALEDLKKSMILCGHPDYEEEVSKFMDDMEKMKGEQI